MSDSLLINYANKVYITTYDRKYADVSFYGIVCRQGTQTHVRKLIGVEKALNRCDNMKQRLRIVKHVEDLQSDRRRGF
jgi:hypothetical protein